MTKPVDVKETGMRKIPIFSLILACCILSLVLYGCSTSDPPLHIRDIRVSPQPAIGKIVTMAVEIENRNPQGYDKIVFELEPTSGILLVDGQKSLNMPIQQGERKTLSIPICVTQEGAQKIRLWVSIPLSANSAMTDRDTLNIAIYGTQTYVVKDQDYRGPAPTPRGYQIPTPGTVTCH